MRRRTTVIRIPKSAPLGRWLVIVCAARDALRREHRVTPGVRRVRGPRASRYDPRTRGVGRRPGLLRSLLERFPHERVLLSDRGLARERHRQQATINKDKDAGMNTYVVIRATATSRSSAANGMKTLLQHTEG